MQKYKLSTDEIKKLTNQMVVLVDSREKKNDHILEYFIKQGIAFQMEKLEYGDYSFMIPASVAGEDIFFHRSIVIERKADLEELSGNLTQQRERFERELLRAGNDGAKVYLMIEAPDGFPDVITHKYHTQFTPAAYMASLKTFEHRFDCHIQFIDKMYAGYFICSTFRYFCRETLK